MIDIDVEKCGGGLSQAEIEALLLDVCARTLKLEGVPRAEVSVVVTGDARVHELNRAYRGVDLPTDVLSFPLFEAGEVRNAFTLEGDAPIALGDIVISVDTAAAQGDEYGHGIRRELAFLAVHGLLHLLGYDHETDAQRAEMRAREERVLASLGLVRDAGAAEVNP